MLNRVEGALTGPFFVFYDSGPPVYEAKDHAARRCRRFGMAEAAPI
jgi:hypothetical protein